MNKEARERFEELVQMDPESLSESDVKFLRARRDYLSPVQREIFGEVLSLTADELVLSKSQLKRVKELQKSNEVQAAKEKELEEKRKSEREATAKRLNGETVDTDDNAPAQEDDVEVSTIDENGNMKPLTKKTKAKK
jgi:hypothetical protein